MCHNVNLHILVQSAYIFTLQGTYEKGTKDEIEEFIYQLLDVTDNGIVGREVEL